MPIFFIGDRVVYFSHIPKTGGSSIEAILKKISSRSGLMSPFLHGKDQLGFPCSPQHLHNAVISQLFGEKFFDYSFCIVRDPLDRLVSEYKYRFKNVVGRGGCAPGFNVWINERLDDFQRNNYVMDNHFRPQFEFIGDNTDVFKYEDGIALAIRSVFLNLDLGDDFFKILDSFPHRNSSGSAVDVKIGPGTRDRIFKTYERDYKDFGYFR